jgi:hypothetical protein
LLPVYFFGYTPNFGSTCRYRYRNSFIHSVHWMRTRVLLRRLDATFLRDYCVLPR